MLLILVLFSLVFFTSFCVFHVKVTLEKYPKSPWHGKPRNWFFMYLVLLMSMWQWDSLVKRKEKSLHHKTKLEAAQLSCVRNDTERLWLIVEQHEQQAQADCSRCKSCTRQHLGLKFFQFFFFFSVLWKAELFVLPVYSIRLECFWCLF